ncbi:MAG TPA: SgcJ/EcaC family oxidoreductase [Gemmatimonadota bacterium]|nr:SgcJ/EcaC family oxidoreductase [Gemmatimonadota bacterium]
MQNLFTAWIDALTAGDSAQVARLHVPHGVFQHPGARGARGRSAIRRACSAWLSGVALPSLVLLDTRMFEPAGVATANGRFTATPRPWGTCADHARGRLLLVAENGEGQWGLRFSGLFSDAFLRELHDLVS